MCTRRRRPAGLSWMSSDRRVARLLVFAAAGAIVSIGTAPAQTVRTYDAPFTSTPPTIDGTVDPDEWELAPVEGDWGLLREDPSLTDLDNTSFRAMWDDEAFYLLLETEFSLWDFSPGDEPTLDLGDNNWNIYWDPNLDGDPNVPDDMIPAQNQDNYQIAFSSFEGTSVMEGENLDGNWFFSGARLENNFGNNTGWRSDVTGLRDIVIAQDNGLGGVAEVKVPWTEFDAPEELEVDDGMGGTTLAETGLHHPFAPSDGDTWFFQLGRISTDPTNFLPVWNWTPSQLFVEHPHGEITFVRTPTVEGIPGDYNNNGQVEQGDLDLVLLNWGQDGTTPPDDWSNDLPSGIIDQEELDGVLLNWGNMAGLSGTGAVPEPTSLVLVGVAVAAACLLRRRSGARESGSLLTGIDVF